MSETTTKLYQHSPDGGNKNYLRNFRLDAVDSDPTLAEVNQLKLNTTDGYLKYHDGVKLNTIALLGKSGQVGIEEYELLSIPADTTITIQAIDLLSVSAVSIRDEFIEITEDLEVRYPGADVVTLRSSVPLSGLQLHLIGRLNLFGSPKAFSLNSGESMTIPSGFAGIRLHGGDMGYDLAYLDIDYSIDGGATQFARLYKNQTLAIDAAEGEEIAITTTPAAQLNVTTIKIPDSYPVPTGETGTANCDVAGAPLWQPTASHITLPKEYSAFKLVADGTARTIFVSEYTGSKWLPAKFYYLEAATDLVIYADYPEIALANYEGLTVDVEAPTGTVIGGNSAMMHFDYPTGGTTHSVTNVAELETAIASAVAGDEIVLADGTYVLANAIDETSFTANLAAGNAGAEGIVIRSLSDDPSLCILQTSLTSHWNFDQLGATQPVYWRGLTFDVAGLNAGVTCKNGIWRIENCIFVGATATDEDLINVVTGDGNSNEFCALNCEFNNSAADCFNGNGVNPVAPGVGSFALLINCRGTNAGDAQNAQILTSHGGFPLYVYGGVFSNAHTNIFANDSLATTPGYIYFASLAAGARQSGVWANTFGCEIEATTATPMVANDFVLFNRVDASAIGSFNSVLRNTLAEVGYNRFSASQGRCYHQSRGGGNFHHNIVDGFSEAVRVADYVGGNPTDNTEIINNSFVNCNIGLLINSIELPCTVKNNAGKDNGNDFAVGTGMVVIGNYNTFAQFDTDYAQGPNDIVANAELDSNLIPIEGGNCDNNGENGVDRGALSN